MTLEESNTREDRGRGRQKKKSTFEYYKCHMCANRYWFSNLDDEFKKIVKLGNNFKMEVVGKGNVKNNLLSIDQLQ